MRRLIVMASTLLAACDGSEPSEVNLVGVWHFTFDMEVIGSDGAPIAGAFCSSVEPIRMTLTEPVDGTFEGTYEGGRTACFPGGDEDTLVANSDPGVVVNGQISGDEVSFDLIAESLHHEGRLDANGRAMSGTAVWGQDPTPDDGFYSGTWAAEKQ